MRKRQRDHRRRKWRKEWKGGRVMSRRRKGRETMRGKEIYGLRIKEEGKAVLERGERLMG